MKDNASAILSILSNDNLGFFVLVELNWNSNHYFTDFGQDVTWGGNRYLSDNPLTSIDNLRYTNVVDRELFKFSVSGLDPAMNAELEAGITHMPVKIRLLFTVDGVPQTASNQTMLIYDGLVSKVDHKITQDDKINLIECTAPLSDLDATGTLFTTKDGIKSFSNDDTSFDLIAEGSEETSLKWGKA